ncbi:ester cyclase [Rhodococcus opacus]|uniref:ester cyclase n=1 Tax=Rhodococcus opacus TaxID=37919 RepID=UPI000ABB5EF0|nr:ester cyclase [Rhodococcus opacus]
MFAAVTDFAFELISIAESGNDVLVHWHLTGRHVGIFVGASSLPDGESTSRDSTTSSSSPPRCATRQVEIARQIKLLPTDGSIADRAMNGVFNANAYSWPRTLPLASWARRERRRENACGVRHTLGIDTVAIIRSVLHRLIRCAGRWCRNASS